MGSAEVPQSCSTGGLYEAGFAPPYPREVRLVMELAAARAAAAAAAAAGSVVFFSRVMEMGRNSRTRFYGFFCVELKVKRFSAVTAVAAT